MPPFRLSAERGGVQPAAELRHLQRHEHERHVPSALSLFSAPNLQSSSTLPAPRSLAFRPAAHPASYAPLLTRQSASSLSNANKLLIRCAWAGNSALASAGYDGSDDGYYGSSSWGSGSCPPSPSAFIIGIMHQWHDGLINSANGINGLFDSANALVTGLSMAVSMVLSIAAIAVAIYDLSRASVPLAFTLATAAAFPGAMPFPPTFGIPYLSIVGALVVLSWVLIVAVLLLMAAGEAVYTLVWGTPINIKRKLRLSPRCTPCRGTAPAQSTIFPILSHTACEVKDVRYAPSV